MSQLALVLGLAIVGLPCCLAASSDLSYDQQPEQRENNLEYALKRGLLLASPPDSNLEYTLKRGPLLSSLSDYYDSRERRTAGSNLGSNFVRYGRSAAAGAAFSQPHTRSDIIIRYGREGRDGLNGRLTRLREERMRRLARLSLVCAMRVQDNSPANSAEEKILKEICRDAPLHPTVPDFV